MTRIHILSEDEMTAEQKAVMGEAKAAGKPHAGPFWAYVRDPQLMEAVQDIASRVAASTLTPREQQIATLAVARFWGARYPWAVQVRNALKLGIDQETVDAINNRRALPSDDRREVLSYDLARELLADKGLSDASYAAAEDAFTTEELVALVARVGSFSMTCCTANAFDLTPPDSAPSRLA